MSESNGALVVLNNKEQALTVGGLGLEQFSRLLEVKPATLEIVQKTSRQENVQMGKFRDTSTNVHYEELQIVLLAMPIEQRQFYEKGTNEFSKDKKLCFSLDNKEPHAKAKEPQAPNCAVCPKGDIGWTKWRQTKNPADVPPCKKMWHLFLADRRTQMPYYLNVKGTSVQLFEFDMQKLGRLLLQLEANAKAENKLIEKANALLLQSNPEAVTQALKPMPNIFDVTFTIYIIQKEKGGPYVLQCKDFKALNEEGKKEFGQLYLDFLERKNRGALQDQLAAEAEAEGKAVTEAPAQEAPKPAEVLGPSTPLAVQGEIVGKNEPITI